MIRNILIGAVVLVAVLVGGAYLTPRNVHVERSITVGAAPEQVFEVLNDMRRFNDWSPWAKLDPNTKYTFEGAATGAGSKMSWQSEDENVGSGSQEIVESVPPNIVKTKLDFGADGVATGTFTITQAEGGSKVTWAFDTDLGMNPVSRYFGLMFDSMVGPDYEKGLANLKTLVESQEKQAAEAQAAWTEGPGLPAQVEADPDKGPQVVTVEARPAVMTRSQAKATDNEAISKALGGAYQKILNYGMAHDLTFGGVPIAVTISHSATDDWVFEAAMPLESLPAQKPADADGVRVGETYAGKAVKLTHKGPYTTMNETYKKIHEYTKKNNLKEKPVAWEEYVGDPAEAEEAELLTNIYVAVE